MRIFANTNDRLTIQFRPWISSAIIWFVIIGVVVQLPNAIANGLLPDLPIMVMILLMAAPIVWWVARWSEFRFDRTAGTLVLTERLFPLLPPLRRSAIPLNAIQRADLQSTHDSDGSLMWCTAVIADPALLPAADRAQSARKQSSWNRYIPISADGIIPLTPYYTPKRKKWIELNRTINQWLGADASTAVPGKQ